MTILFVDKDGEVQDKKFTRRDNPEEMKALRVNLGALGFVYLLVAFLFYLFILILKIFRHI